jgi:putative Ca2+/H+ antiporter (TMEM165/GDT1 family)
VETLFNSFLLVFVSEMGDRTQILALILALKYKKPLLVLSAIFFATLLNHGLAFYLGVLIASFLSPDVLRWVLALTFIIFGLWLLKPDKDEGLESESKFGPFVTSFVLFFLAEMGDKTQLATVALGAKYSNLVWVTMGSTLGMMASNTLAVYLGDALLKKIPMSWVRKFACLTFIVFALFILWAD